MKKKNKQIDPKEIVESFLMLAVSSTLNVLNCFMQSASSSAPAITYRSDKIM